MISYQKATGYTSVRITCDSCWRCDLEELHKCYEGDLPCPPFIVDQDKTVSRMREEVKSWGWACKEKSDLCPKCVKEKKKGKAK